MTFRLLPRPWSLYTPAPMRWVVLRGHVHAEHGDCCRVMVCQRTYMRVVNPSAPMSARMTERDESKRCGGRMHEETRQVTRDIARCCEACADDQDMWSHTLAEVQPVTVTVEPQDLGQLLRREVERMKALEDLSSPGYEDHLRDLGSKMKAAMTGLSVAAGPLAELLTKGIRK